MTEVTTPLDDRDRLVTIPASVLYELREVAAATYTLARQVDGFKVEVAPALAAYAAYLQRLQGAQDDAVAAAAVANKASLTAVKKWIPYLLALIFGGGWFGDRVLLP